MLYFLYKILNINILNYITVRAGIAFFAAFFLTAFFMPRFIAWAKNKHANQPIYELAPQSHKAKNKTPTMGGIVFITATLLSSLICANLTNTFVIGGILCLFGFSFIGFKDDYGKIAGHSNHAGMSPRKKFMYQIGLSFALSIILFLFANLSGEFFIPFYKYALFNLQFFAIFFWMLVITASSNSVNLTDGLDGLASIPSIFALVSLGIFVYLCGHSVFSAYLFLPKVVGVGELCVVIFALIGAILGFLWYNCYPAQVFMGDSGSLSVGAFIGYIGVVSKNEILLIIIGFVFVIETLSVILQVGSFKIRKKRIFLMAPIHHHFELKGWNENKIIVRFWIIALIANIIALTTLKLR